MTTADRMTMEDFKQAGSVPKTGMTAWLRSLPVNTPTRVPEELIDSALPVPTRSNRVRGSAHAAGLNCVIRTIDGETWVAITERK